MRSIEKHTVLSEVLGFLRNSNTSLLSSAGVFLTIVYDIYTRWSCLWPRARELISRGGEGFPRGDEEPAVHGSSRARVCACMRRCQRWQVCACVSLSVCVFRQDGCGWLWCVVRRRYGRGGRCVPKQVALLLWVLTTFCTLYTHKVPFSWIYFFPLFSLGRLQHDHRLYDGRQSTPRVIITQVFLCVYSSTSRCDFRFESHSRVGR